MAVILIIDDEPQVRRMLARVLKLHGHDLYEAANGKEGMGVFSQVHPALVITDIVMPEAEGIETIQWMHREAPAMPILAISGGAKPALYLRAAGGLGASAVLEKPFDNETLIETVNRLLHSPSSRPAN